MNNVVYGAKCNNKKLTHPPFNEFAPHQMMLFVCKKAFRLTLITCRPVSPLVRMIRSEGIILTQDRPKRTGPASLRGARGIQVSEKSTPRAYEGAPGAPCSQNLPSFPIWIAKKKRKLVSVEETGLTS